MERRDNDIDVPVVDYASEATNTAQNAQPCEYETNDVMHMPFEKDDDEDDNELSLDSVPTCRDLLRAQWVLLKDVPATLHMHYFEIKPVIDEYFADASERVNAAWTAARRAWERHRR